MKAVVALPRAGSHLHQQPLFFRANLYRKDTCQDRPPAETTVANWGISFRAFADAHLLNAMLLHKSVMAEGVGLRPFYRDRLHLAPPAGWA